MNRLVPLLIGVAFLDELASGIPFVGSPEIKSEFGLSYAEAAGWLLFVSGALAALQYPIAKAQAYRALPGRSGAVNAVLTLFGVIELPLPVAIGNVADRFGLGVALATLALQPIGLVLLVVSMRRGTDPELVDP